MKNVDIVAYIAQTCPDRLDKLRRTNNFVQVIHELYFLAAV